VAAGARLRCARPRHWSAARGVSIRQRSLHVDCLHTERYDPWWRLQPRRASGWRAKTPWAVLEPSEGCTGIGLMPERESDFRHHGQTCGAASNADLRGSVLGRRLPAAAPLPWPTSVCRSFRRTAETTAEIHADSHLRCGALGVSNRPPLHRQRCFSASSSYLYALDTWKVCVMME